MRKVYCDICGTDKNVRIILEIEGTFIYHKLDLCENCAKEIIKKLKEMKKVDWEWEKA